MLGSVNTTDMVLLEKTWMLSMSEKYTSLFGIATGEGGGKREGGKGRGKREKRKGKEGGGGKRG